MSVWRCFGELELKIHASDKVDEIKIHIQPN